MQIIVRTAQMPADQEGLARLDTSFRTDVICEVTPLLNVDVKHVPQPNERRRACAWYHQKSEAARHGRAASLCPGMLTGSGQRLGAASAACRKQSVTWSITMPLACRNA